MRKIIHILPLSFLSLHQYSVKKNPSEYKSDVNKNNKDKHHIRNINLSEKTHHLMCFLAMPNL